MNDGGMQGGSCPEHGPGSLIVSNSYLPTCRWTLLDGKGLSPFGGNLTLRQPILGDDGLQTQPFSDLLLVSCIEYDSLILHHRSHDGLCGVLDLAHPAVVALSADTLHCKSRCALPVPFLIHVFLGTFRPSSMTTLNDFAWLRRRRLGSHQDLACPKRDNVLRGGWRPPTEDASSPRWWYDAIHGSCTSTETKHPEKARDSGAQAPRRSLRTKKAVKARPSTPRATSPFHPSPRTLILSPPSTLADGPAP
jgi:hypothetical protein